MNSSWCVPALRGILGDWIYYSALLKAEHLSKWIKTSHEIREAKALEDFLQRKLKPRKSKIAKYLIQRDSRFFNSIIVGVFDALPSWAEFDLTKVPQKLEHGITEQVRESIGLLIFTGKEKIFAIDGQHRVEGIKEAYQKDPKRIGEDQYPVIFVAHLDTPDGKVRSRRLFCDINKNAVSVSEGDTAVIDEDDLCAIVTRQIYASYPSFKNGTEVAVTEKKEVLGENGKEKFTNLLALYTVTKKIKRLFRKETGTLESDPKNVENLKAIVVQFFDFVIKHEPSFARYFKKEITLVAERENNRNLFFRPIGLEVLARLYVHFSKHENLSRLSVGLKKINFLNPGGIFDGVLWFNGKIQLKGKKSAIDLCLYVLGELDNKQSGELLIKLRETTRNPNYNFPTKLASS